MKTAEILNKEKLTREDLLYLMNTEDPKDLNLIYEKAYEIKEKEVGKKVFIEGL